LIDRASRFLNADVKADGSAAGETVMECAAAHREWESAEADNRRAPGGVEARALERLKGTKQSRTSDLLQLSMETSCEVFNEI
jgi:hypothetical protein